MHVTDFTPEERSLLNTARKADTATTLWAIRMLTFCARYPDFLDSFDAFVEANGGHSTLELDAKMAFMDIWEATQSNKAVTV